VSVAMVARALLQDSLVKLNQPANDRGSAKKERISLHLDGSREGNIIRWNWPLFPIEAFIQFVTGSVNSLGQKA